ncbi:MAG: hypothetical protein ACE147_01970 [Candidatus Methylomirabilales bacterium]
MREAEAPARPGEDALRRLTGALRRWGRLMVDAGRTVDAPAFEQVVGGLVEWTGNELLDGWLHLPIPLFEAVSELAEELFRAGQSYHAAMRACGTLPAADRAAHEQAILEVLTGVEALEKRGSGPGGQGRG